MGSKDKQDRYDRLNNRYGIKYGLEGRAVAHIRSANITDKQTKAQIAAKCQEKIDHLHELIARHTKEAERFIKTRIWLEKCTDEEFADITNPKPE